MKSILQKSTLGLVLVLSTTAVLFPTLENGWTSWDDKVYILDNPLVKSLTAESVSAIFTTPEYNGAYTPFPMLSWAVNYHFTGIEPFPFHLTNLVLHLVNTLLCFVFVQLLTRNLAVAFVVGLLFGIHPMHLEPIAWITGRKDLVLGLFSLGGLIAWTKSEDPEQNSYAGYGLAVLFTVLALFSKGTAVVLPVWFLLISVLKCQKPIIKTFIKLLPLWIVAFGFGLLAIASQQDSGAMDSVEQINFLKAFAFTIVSLGTYVIKLIIPYHIGPAHNYPDVITLSNSIGFVIAAILYCTTIAYLICIGNKKTLLLSGLFFLVGVLPILQFLPVGYALTADRYVYLPYLGGFLAIGLLLSKLTQKDTFLKKLSCTGFTIYVLILGFQTWSSASIWKSDLTLWNHEIAFHGYAPRAYVNRGHYYVKNGMTQLALADYNTAISQDPELKEAYQKKGLALQELQRYQEAEVSFVKALEIDSSYSPAMLNLALNAYHQGNFQAAFSHFDRAKQVEPNNLLVYLNLGVLLQQLGRYEAAISNYNTAIQVAPFNIRGYRFRGVLFYELGRMQEALSDFEKWRTLNAKDPMAYRWLARWHSRNGNEQRFLENAELARQLNGAFEQEEFEQLQKAVRGYSSIQSER